MHKTRYWFYKRMLATWNRTKYAYPKDDPVTVKTRIKAFRWNKIKMFDCYWWKKFFQWDSHSFIFIFLQKKVCPKRNLTVLYLFLFFRLPFFSPECKRPRFITKTFFTTHHINLNFGRKHRKKTSSVTLVFTYKWNKIPKNKKIKYDCDRFLKIISRWAVIDAYRWTLLNRKAAAAAAAVLIYREIEVMSHRRDLVPPPPPPPAFFLIYFRGGYMNMQIEDERVNGPARCTRSDDAFVIVICKQMSSLDTFYQSLLSLKITAYTWTETVYVRKLYFISLSPIQLFDSSPKLLFFFNNNYDYLFTLDNLLWLILIDQ